MACSLYFVLKNLSSSDYLQVIVEETKGLSEFGVMCTSLPSSEMSQLTTRNKIPTIQYQR
jgi:hypothetical protein